MLQCLKVERQTKTDDLYPIQLCLVLVSISLRGQNESSYGREEIFFFLSKVCGALVSAPGKLPLH